MTVRDLGVVVLAYGRENKHVPLLTDLSAAGVADEQIVVVHNPDRPPDGWRPACPPAGTLLAQPRNLGYAGAMNLAIRSLCDHGFQMALLLTHDARVQADTVTRLMEAANAAPDCGVLGLAVAGAGGASGATVSYGWYMRADGSVKHITERPGGDLVADVPFVDGSAMFLRLLACGKDPLPERYFMYFEEAEICSAVRQRGWRVGVALQAAASSASGTRHRTVAFAYLYARNGLDWTLQYEGMLAALRFALQELWRGAWQGTPKPGRGLRNASAWRIAVQLLAARLLGLIDFARKRWGPPPQRLLRMSDIRHT